MMLTAALTNTDVAPALASAAHPPVAPCDPSAPGPHTCELRDLGTLTALIGRARAEFVEMPGMQLTLRQAARLWGLDSATCDYVLGVLAGSGFLTKREDRYARASGA